jgi:hypothetical protein
MRLFGFESFAVAQWFIVMRQRGYPSDEAFSTDVDERTMVQKFNVRPNPIFYELR